MTVQANVNGKCGFLEE